jgi:hypothetical protein
MSKRTYILAFIPILLTSCSGRYIERCIWQDKPLFTEGSYGIWPIPNYYNNKTRLSYTVSNDQKNLYLCFKTTDEFTQMKILKSGMEVWIDTNGGKHQNIGILYPVQGIRKHLPPLPEQPVKGVRPDKRLIKKRIIDENQFVKLIGFKNCNTTPLRLKDQQCLSLKMDIDSDNANTLVYRIVIPFASFFKENLKVTDSNVVFRFMVLIDAFASAQLGDGSQRLGESGGAPDGMPPGRPQMGENSQGVPGNPGVHGGPGGPGGMHPPGGMDDMSTQNEETSFNIKFRLSVR